MIRKVGETVPSSLWSLGFDTLWQPAMIVQSVLLQALYLLVTVGPLRRWFPGATRPTGLQMAAFLGGLWLLYFSFGSPIDVISDDYLFSVHMIQHELETMLMVPLLMYGTPAWLLRPVLRPRPILQTMKVLTDPLFAPLPFGITFSLFHIPSVYGFTLSHEWFHFIEHVLFFLTAVVMWWPLTSTSEALPRLSVGKRILYIFYGSGMTMPVTVLLFVAQRPWYNFYVQSAHMWGLSALGDQQLGGVIMFVTMLVIYIPLALAEFVKYDDKSWYE